VSGEPSGVAAIPDLGERLLDRSLADRNADSSRNALEQRVLKRQHVVAMPSKREGTRVDASDGVQRLDPRGPSDLEGSVVVNPSLPARMAALHLVVREAERVHAAVESEYDDAATLVRAHDRGHVRRRRLAPK